MTWPFDPSRPVVTPEDNAKYMRRRAGLGEAEWALPSTLVATFQPQSWHHLASRCDLGVAGPGPMVQPLRGQIQGRSIAAARMMIGAPGAAITMENAIARGVRNVLVVGSAGSLRQDLTIRGAVLVIGAERADARPAWEPGFDDQRYLDTLTSAADAVLDCALELVRA